MAAEYRTFSVTVPAGTLASAPQVTALDMPARIVRSVRIRVPPGPLGAVGFALGAAGVPIVPWNGEWMVADDEAIDWPLEGQIDSGAWQLHAYNTGSFDHTIYVTFALDLPGAGVSVVSSPLAITPA